jgi:hypothetical protein
VEAGEPVQGCGPSPGKPDAHEATVAPALLLSNQSLPASPLYQSYDGVVASLHKLRQFADGRPSPAGISCDSQKQEVLLRGQAVFTSGPFAEAQETAKIVAEPGKPTEYARVPGLRSGQ